MNAQTELLKFLVKLRVLNLFYHQAHNIAARVSFFGDHDALGDFYNQANSQYDTIAERIVGSFGSQALNLQMIMAMVCENLKTLPSEASENKILFQAGLKTEEELQAIGEVIVKMPIPEGTRQLVGDVLDKSMSRMYKIKRRIA